MLLPRVIYAQATYGNIAPVGGVTASLGQELTFTYANQTGATYYWSAYPSVSTIPLSSIVFTTDINTRTVKVKFMEPMVAFLCVTRYNVGKQPAMECVSFNVVSCNPPPTPGVISGPSPIVSCGDYTYSIAPVIGASGYQWSGFTTGDKQTTNPAITVSSNDFKLGNNTLKVKALNDCGGAGIFRSKTISMSGISSPTSLTGPDNIQLPLSSAVTYSTSPVNLAGSYKWTGFATGDKVTTTPSVSVISADFNEGINNLRVVAIDLCDTESSGFASLDVNVTSLGSPVSITGPATIDFCGNANYTTENVLGAVRYVWSGFITGDKITMVPTVNAEYVDFAPGTSTLTVVAEDATGNSNGSASIALSIPAKAILSELSGPTNPLYCSPSSYTVNPYPNAIDYVWTTSFGFSRTTTIASLTLLPDDIIIPPGQSFNLSVFARSCVNSNTSIKVITPQLTLSPISGPNQIGCVGGTFSISPVCFATEYQWTIDGVPETTSQPQVTVFGFDHFDPVINIQVQARVRGQLTQAVSRVIMNNCDQGPNPLAVNPQTIISPNPAKSSFTVNEIKPIESFSKSEIRVLNQEGRLIKSYETTATEMNIDNLPLDDGLYLIEIKSEGKREFRKLLIKK